MTVEDDITHWIEGLKEGEQAAAEQIWEKYFQRLILLARRKLGRASRRVADEEDVVVSAFNSFYQRAVHGHIPKLDNRDDLWKLLVVITVRKSYARIQYDRAAKRGAGTARGESVFISAGNDARQGGLDQALSKEPTPAFAAMVTETCEGLLKELDEQQREIAVAKMEGYTNEEISERLGISTRAVTRKLSLIRKQWSRGTKE